MIPESSTVLLLNPPGKKIYIRDYYCSKTTKSNYLFHPLDLLVLSGRLSGFFRVASEDAMVKRLSPDKALEKVALHTPAAVIAMTGAVSMEEDLPFLEAVRTRTGVPLLVSGDLFMEEPGMWLERYPFLDGIILDFTNEDALHFLRGEHRRIENMAYRDAGCVVVRDQPRVMNRQFELPVPRHDLFQHPGYRYSFSRKRRFASVLTDYGCPFRCSFCIMSTLGFKVRPVENVMEELRFIRRMGIDEIFFIDQTFGAVRQRTLKLCAAMREQIPGAGWSCFSRVDVVDPPLLEEMRQAGCHTIILGVETANEDILRQYRKGYSRQQIRNAFSWCRRLGIRTVGTFILGLPEETAETVEETLDFAKSLECDFASFNLAVPRMGTELRKQVLEEGLLEEKTFSMDQTGRNIAMPTRLLSRDEMHRLRRRFILGFYLRPSYLCRRLWRLKSWYELRAQVVEGWEMLRGVMWPG